MNSDFPLNKECLIKNYKYNRKFTQVQHFDRIQLIKKKFSEYDIEKNARILDTGCGSGAYTILFNKLGYRNVISTDLYTNGLKKTLLEWAKNEKYNNKPLSNIMEPNPISSDICSLPFKDDTFDFVLCSEVLEHLDNPDKGIKELSRVLKKDHYIFITVPNKLSPHYYPRWWYYKFKKDQEKLDHTKFTKYNILKLFRKSSLQCKEILGSGSRLPVPFSTTLFFTLKKII